jgi:hypothetical protein
MQARAGIAADSRTRRGYSFGSVRIAEVGCTDRGRVFSRHAREARGAIRAESMLPRARASQRRNPLTIVEDNDGAEGALGEPVRERTVDGVEASIANLIPGGAETQLSCEYNTTEGVPERPPRALNGERAMEVPRGLGQHEGATCFARNTCVRAAVAAVDGTARACLERNHGTSEIGVDSAKARPAPRSVRGGSQIATKASPLVRSTDATSIEADASE